MLFITTQGGDLPNGHFMLWPHSYSILPIKIKCRWNKDTLVFSILTYGRRGGVMPLSGIKQNTHHKIQYIDNQHVSLYFQLPNTTAERTLRIEIWFRIQMLPLISIKRFSIKKHNHVVINIHCCRKEMEKKRKLRRVVKQFILCLNRIWPIWVQEIPDEDLPI